MRGYKGRECLDNVVGEREHVGCRRESRAWMSAACFVEDGWLWMCCRFVCEMLDTNGDAEM